MNKVEDIEQEFKGSSLLSPNDKPYPFEKIQLWISELKPIIVASDAQTVQANGQLNGDADGDGEIFADYVDDFEQFHANQATNQIEQSNNIRWTLRVKAFKLVRKLIDYVNGNSTSQLQATRNIIKLLPDLIRVSFVAASSPYDLLKLEGFQMFLFLIKRFADIEEKEMPGRSIIEQYRTQVMTALKPAFDSEAPPYITASAVQVASAWIVKNLDKDLPNFKRTYHLMSLAYKKLNDQGVNQNNKLFEESELEQERLSILGAWAQVYIYSSNISEPQKSLDSVEGIIKKDQNKLSRMWIEALKDYALLVGPSPRSSTNLRDDKGIFTRDAALALYEPVWFFIGLAMTIKLTTVSSKDATFQETYQKDIKLLSSIFYNDLMSFYNKTDNFTSLPESTISVLKSLRYLFRDSMLRSVFLIEKETVQEYYTLLFSLTKKIHHQSSKDIDTSIIYESITKLIEHVVENNIFDTDQLYYGICVLLKSINNSLNNFKTNEPSEKQLKFMISVLAFISKKLNIRSFLKEKVDIYTCYLCLLEKCEHNKLISRKKCR